MKNIIIILIVVVIAVGIYIISINNKLEAKNTTVDNIDVSVDINNSGPSIYIESANQVVISIVSGTTNTLIDGSNYSNLDKDVEGAIYSKDDLILEGSGILIVKGNKGDAIVSCDDLKINGGTYEITSEDDAIRGKDSVYILDGNFTITKSYEGLEAETVTINDGDIDIISSDDGINVAGGNDSSAYNRPWVHQNSGSSSDSTLTINGGNINVDASGDGLDANGSIFINGGSVVVNGPTDNGMEHWTMTRNV